MTLINHTMKTMAMTITHLDLVQGEPEAGAMSLYGLQLPRLYEEGPRERQVLGVPYITANLYCKSHNLSNTDIRNYSIDLR